jgi:hypothetical protein
MIGGSVKGPRKHDLEFIVTVSEAMSFNAYRFTGDAFRREAAAIDVGKYRIDDRPDASIAFRHDARGRIVGRARHDSGHAGISGTLAGRPG